MKKSQLYRKPYRVRKKRSILKNRALWYSLLILALVAGAFYLVYFLPYIQIHNVDARNLSVPAKVSAEDVRNLASQNIGQDFLMFNSKSILFLDSNKIKNSILQQYPQIDKVIVKRILPNKVAVEVQERQPYALFCKSDNNCWYFDNNGIAFEWVQNNPLPMIQIRNLSYADDVRLGDKIVTEDFLKKIEKLNDKIINDLKINIAEFEIPSQGRLNVKTADGWEIYFDPAGDLNWQGIELGLVLQQKIPPDKVGNLEYIDLRFSKVFYKYRDSAK